MTLLVLSDIASIIVYLIIAYIGINAYIAVLLATDKDGPII